MGMDEGTSIVTGLLKRFLRELPEPLLTWQVFDEFYEFQKKGLCFPILSLNLSNKQPIFSLPHQNEIGQYLSLISFLYPLEVTKEEEAKFLLSLLLSLPPVNLAVMKTLTQLFIQIKEKESQNKMGSGTIFSPTLILTSSLHLFGLKHTCHLQGKHNSNIRNG